MLSIGKLTAAQTGYYEGQVAQGLDDYYMGRGEAPGEWMGAGAALLGLAGEVDEEGFAALMAGLDPGWAGVVGAPSDFTRNWSYTALSRSRQPSELFVAHEHGRHLADGDAVAREAPAVHRGVLEDLSLTMSRRDDEDLALDRSLEEMGSQPMRRVEFSERVRAEKLCRDRSHPSTLDRFY